MNRLIISVNQFRSEAKCPHKGATVWKPKETTPVNVPTEVFADCEQVLPDENENDVRVDADAVVVTPATTSTHKGTHVRQDSNDSLRSTLPLSEEHQVISDTVTENDMIVDRIDTVRQEPILAEKFIAQKNVYQALVDESDTEEEDKIEVFVNHEVVNIETPTNTKDHSPIVLTWHNSVKNTFPFKFSNAWVLHSEYQELLQYTWNIQVHGNPIAVLTAKLRALKASLKEWSRKHFYGLHKQVTEAKDLMLSLQKLLHDDPPNCELAHKENEAREAFMVRSRMEEADLKQRTDCLWMQYGDKNTSYFHNIIKERKSHRKIWTIVDRQGQAQHDHEAMAQIFIDYYQSLMGLHTTDGLEVEFYDKIAYMMWQMENILLYGLNLGVHMYYSLTFCRLEMGLTYHLMQQ
ncbi:hypothetical protein IFM89_015360 [Coptis chinensis]|uniref:Uncharacterized protein n=1 Tax=Coptis chinensis TaxID=261450 RepID=A0A835IE37_9MAGN|nr:hypothetical protein IFM89_015360 [Coptis chinensis]